METCAATITVEHLVGVVVETAETYLAVRLEEVLCIAAFALGWLEETLAVNQELQLLAGLVGEAMLEVLQDGDPHQEVADVPNLGLDIVGLGCLPDCLG